RGTETHRRPVIANRNLATAFRAILKRSATSAHEAIGKSRVAGALAGMTGYEVVLLSLIVKP
ncbi:hypothetical protein, partial [Mycobacterium sp.]|uniref:hypothetical protein n=1 Tax=Mycobacterium sp. TaxID=1785 RepID=UPI0025D4E369